MSAGRGDQDEYNRILDGYGAANRPFHDCVDYIISLGFTRNQANNAVHVYKKGGQTHAAFRLTADQRDFFLDSFGARHKTPKECVDHLMTKGCTYRQATSAVYKYRQERGLIRSPLADPPVNSGGEYELPL